MWVLCLGVEGDLRVCCPGDSGWALGSLICKDLLNLPLMISTWWECLCHWNWQTPQCSPRASLSACHWPDSSPLLHWKVPAISLRSKTAVSAPVNGTPVVRDDVVEILPWRGYGAFFLLFKDTLIGCYWPQMWVIMACLGRGICKRGHF